MNGKTGADMNWRTLTFEIASVWQYIDKYKHNMYVQTFGYTL